MAPLPFIFRKPGAAPAAATTPATALHPEQRRHAHMAASLLLDYPDAEFRQRAEAVAASLGSLPASLADEFRAFTDYALATDERAIEAEYVATFDLKRRCCLYLTYFLAGDTRRRGAALLAFLHAYRDAGWEFDADELPDFLPAVLEFSARSDSPTAAELIAAHREGIEVLREALEKQESPWASVVRAVCRSLPQLDAATRERYLALVNQGPPAETVGLSFPAGIPPFALSGAASEEVRA